MDKKERQLARQKEIQEQRRLRRQEERSSFVLCDEQGIIKGTARNASDKLAQSLSQNPGVISAKWNDLEKPIRHKKGPFVVAMEFCPIYTAGTSLTESTLVQNAHGEKDIQSSRVGAKWNATMLALKALQDICDLSQRQLVVSATFADIGVLVATKKEADIKVVRQHEDLYKKSLDDFCRQNDITLKFQRLSEITPLSGSRKVPQFLVAEEGRVVDHRPSLDEAMSLLGLTDAQIPFSSERLRRRAEILLRLLDGCNGNIDTWKGLIFTYINYHPSQECDIHVGVERSDNLLALQVLPANSDVAKIPKLNIVVQ